MQIYQSFLPTFDAFAFHLGKYLPEITNYVIAVSANIEELYFAKFAKNKMLLSLLDELKLIAKKDLENILDSGEVVYGNVGGSGRVNPLLDPLQNQ